VLSFAPSLIFFDCSHGARLLEVLREKQQNMEEALEALSQEWLVLPTVHMRSTFPPPLVAKHEQVACGGRRNARGQIKRWRGP
jgi:hypothetical protein